MSENTESILNERSENGEFFENFIQAIFNDYDSGAIDRTQAAIALKHAFVLLEKGYVTTAIDWMRTGRKHIRTL